MTNQEHPITPPPPELVKQWTDMWSATHNNDSFSVYIVTAAAQWGADQELEACCKYMKHEDFHGFASELRAARRPKPSSLKERLAKAIADGDKCLALQLLNEALPND